MLGASKNSSLRQHFRDLKTGLRTGFAFPGGTRLMAMALVLTLQRVVPKSYFKAFLAYLQNGTWQLSS